MICYYETRIVNNFIVIVGNSFIARARIERCWRNSFNFSFWDIIPIIQFKIISISTGILSLLYVTWAMLKIEGMFGFGYGIYLNIIASVGLIIGALFIDKKAKSKKAKN